MKKGKQLWLLAGGNGVGKSTFYETRLQPKGLPFINADIIARQLFPNDPEEHSYDAAIVATELRNQCLADGKSFCFETVFSHPTKIDFVADAKTMGYEIILVFIHLESNQLNQARISQRVSEGGHNVPVDKVISRIPRTLRYIRKTLPLCDQVYVLNNSSFENPFEHLATLRNGVLDYCVNVLPEWAIELLQDYRVDDLS